MSALECILGMLPDRVSSGKQDQIFTPPHIAKEMVNALPEDVWNRYTTFFDPICKSGIFLYEIYQKLMESEDLIEAYPDPTDRREYIINNQLFGVAVDPMCQMMSIRTVYGYLKSNSHIILLSNYQTIMRNTDKRFLLETLQKEFGMKKFGVIIGNPPYNNDAYLDFVQLGHKLASKYTMMITPAKWQAKGGTKNEDFRREIVPYMSEIVYYPYTKDVFDVTVGGGITFYIINGNRDLSQKQILKIKSIDKRVIFKNETTFRDKNRQTYFNDIYENIVNKIIDGRQQLTIGNYKDAPCYVEVSHLSADKDKSNCMGGLITTPFYKSASISCIQNIHTIFSGTESECDSFISFVNTKTVRFLLMLSLYVPITNNICWRFVPAPEAFDHIFTDAELYEKYNLSEEEISIIESVVKERK